VAVLDDSADFGVDQFRGCLAVAGAKRRRQAGVLRGDEADRTELSLIPHRKTIWRAISVTCCRSFSAPVVATP
jgi:hypothetical protein